MYAVGRQLGVNAMMALKAQPRFTAAATCLCCLFLLYVPSGFASGNVRIVDLGIEGYFSTAAPTGVIIELQNPAPTPVEVVVSYEVEPRQRAYRRIYGGRTDYIAQPLQLQAQERRTHAVPLLLNVYDAKLTVKLHDNDGKLLGQDERLLEKSAGNLVVLLCGHADRCQSAENGIKSAGTIQEQAQKQQRLTFVRPKPVDKWWKYLIAQTIVLADAVQLTAQQRKALEEYVRQGGTLVDLSGARGVVLDDYKSAAIAQPVSKGMLYRTTNINDARLNAYWAGQEFFPYFGSSFYDDNRSYFRSRLATSFSFPRLRWLLAWFAAYILIVGPLNFAILRRMKRLELGWLTVPSIALLFAFALYWWGARDRPRQFGIDEMAIYWLDGRSRVAGTDLTLRVSSPERRQVTLSLPTEAVYTGGSDERPGLSFPNVFFGVASDNGSLAEPRRVWLGPPQRLQIAMARWSFKDAHYIDLQTLPGTLRMLRPNVLHNATGKRFREAVYLDANGDLHELGAVGPGEIDTSAAPGKSLRDLRERHQKGEKVGGSLLVDFLISPPYRSELREARDLFLGISEEPVLGASLVDIPFVRKNYAVVVARLGAGGAVSGADQGAVTQTWGIFLHD
jgi:hypothetical protein